MERGALADQRKDAKVSQKERADKLEVKVGKDDNIEAVVKRFSRKVRDSGLLSEIFDRRYYEKKSQKRKKKALKAKLGRTW